MQQNARDHARCKAALAIVSGLHWLALMLYLEPFGIPESTWQYTRMTKRLAAVLLESLSQI